MNNPAIPKEIQKEKLNDHQCGTIKRITLRATYSLDQEGKQVSLTLTKDVFGAQLTEVLELKVYVDDGHAARDGQHDDIAARNLLED